MYGDSCALPLLCKCVAIMYICMHDNATAFQSIRSILVGISSIGQEDYSRVKPPMGEVGLIPAHILAAYQHAMGLGYLSTILRRQS